MICTRSPLAVGWVCIQVSKNIYSLKKEITPLRLSKKSTGDISELFDDMQALNPTIVSATPRLWNRIYAEYQQALFHAMIGVPLEATTHLPPTPPPLISIN